MTKPRRRTVAAAIAAGLAIGFASAAFAFVSRSSAGAPRPVQVLGGFEPPTTVVEASTLPSLVPVPSGRGSTTGVAPAGTTPTAAAPAATAQRLPTCSTRQVGISVVTDRESYRPGDVVVVTATVKNATAVACNAPQLAADGVCQPRVGLSSPFKIGTPTVNLGPFAGSCGVPNLVVPARAAVTAVIEAPFRIGTGAAGSSMPAGVWKVVLTWPGLSGTISAQTTLRCDLPACGSPASGTTLPTLPPVTTPALSPAP